jgi:hypothetical protein
MRQLNCRDCALGLHELSDAGQRSNVGLQPQSQIAGRNASLGADRGGLDENGSSTAYGSAAKMNELPVIRNSVDVAVLTHWRNYNSVWNCDGALGERRKEVIGCHGHRLFDAQK